MMFIATLHIVCTYVQYDRCMYTDSGEHDRWDAFRIYESLLNAFIHSTMLVAYCKTGNVSTPLNLTKLAFRLKYLSTKILLGVVKVDHVLMGAVQRKLLVAIKTTNTTREAIVLAAY